MVTRDAETLCAMEKMDTFSQPLVGMSQQAQFDQALDALGHQYRRRLAVRLLEHNPQDTKTVSKATTDAGIDAIERVHVHLPKLETAGYITWDRESGIVEKGPRWEEVVSVVKVLQAHEDELPGHLI